MQIIIVIVARLVKASNSCNKLHTLLSRIGTQNSSTCLFIAINEMKFISFLWFSSTWLQSCQLTDTVQTTLIYTLITVYFLNLLHDLEEEYIIGRKFWALSHPEKSKYLNLMSSLKFEFWFIFFLQNFQVA